MNQADVSKLVSRLRIRVAPTPRRLRNPRGSEGRLDKMRKTVTGLIKYERIELNSNTAEEARGYAERLISDAIRYGDHNADMMEMADYWLEEKQLVHKLFKVLVPRFENSSGSYTKIYRAPGSSYPVSDTRAVVELRGNPFPPLTKDLSHNRNLLHNVLLDAAKKEFRRQQYEKIAKGSGTAEVNESKPEAQESTSSAAAEREPSAKTQQPISGELADASTDPTTPGEVKIGKSELKLPQQPSSS